MSWPFVLPVVPSVALVLLPVALVLLVEELSMPSASDSDWITAWPNPPPFGGGGASPCTAAAWVSPAVRETLPTWLVWFSEYRELEMLLMDMVASSLI
jgi:hypothetical protein